MKYEKNMTNFEWLNTISPIKDKNWHNENVIRVNQIENIDFYENRKNSYKAYINPNDIKGIQYLDNYNHTDDITWKQLLNCLKRFDEVREKSTNYDLIFNHIHNEYNQPKTVCKYGNTLITSSGQHRLALAKFLNLQSVAVTIIEYEFNDSKYRRYSKTGYMLDKLRDYNLANYEREDYMKIWQELRFSIIINESDYSLKKSDIDRIISIYQSINLKNPFYKIALPIYNRFDKKVNKQFNELGDIRSLKLALANHKTKFV